MSDLYLHIDFERTGGFTGMRLSATIDSESLDDDQINALLDQLESANFFDLPPKLDDQSGGPDRFCYRLSVHTDEQENTVEISETAVPEPLRPVLQQLTELARKGRAQ